MKDYQTIWTKWITFLNSDLKFRKEILESIHIEVKNGFEVITRIALEELESKFSEKELFEKIKNDLLDSIGITAWSGYALLIIEHGIDPIKANLVARPETNELGNLWEEQQNKDQGKGLTAKIDPVLMIFLEKQTQNQINGLLLQYDDLVDLPYKLFGHIETFHAWAAYQGYILGMLEMGLNSEKK